MRLSTFIASQSRCIDHRYRYACTHSEQEHVQHLDAPSEPPRSQAQRPRDVRVVHESHSRGHPIEARERPLCEGRYLSMYLRDCRQIIYRNVLLSPSGLRPGETAKAL